MDQVVLTDEQKEEIQTLRNVYDKEVTITITNTLKIAYVANINDDTEITTEFTLLNNNDTPDTQVIISVQNASKSTKKLSQKLLTNIETLLHHKYQEEIDSMPIFQCISYCSNELIDVEQISIVINSNNNNNDSNHTTTKPQTDDKPISSENDEIKIPELAINELMKQYLCKPNKIKQKIGIVGLPNIGKSSFFNLMSSKKVPAENYPFCTIKPSQCQVAVPCAKFINICNIMNEQRDAQLRHSSALLTVYDIAGLVRGAHKGDGLGNEFLSNIQSVGAIYHMVRAFEIKKRVNGKTNKEKIHIEHVEGSVDPIRDLNIISYELRQKDLNVMNNKLLSLMRKLKHQNSALNSVLKNEYVLVDKIVQLLGKGLDIGCVHSWSEKDIEYIHSYNLFSCKPAVFVVNVSENDWNKGKGSNKWIKDINEWVDKYYPGSKVLEFCAMYEQKQRDLNEVEWKMNSVVNDIICVGYEALELIHFMTINSSGNVRCWTIRKGMKAINAARRINIEIEKHFICVETCSYADFKQYDYDMTKVKANGKYIRNGKNYVVENGDILYFKWNKGSNYKKS